MVHDLCSGVVTDAQRTENEQKEEYSCIACSENGIFGAKEQKALYTDEIAKIREEIESKKNELALLITDKER